MKFYLTISSLSLLLFLVPINFSLPQEIFKNLSQLSPQQLNEVIAQFLILGISVIIIFYLTIVDFLQKFEKKIKGEEEKLKKLLSVTPYDPWAKHKLAQINSRKRYFEIVKLFFGLILFILTIIFASFGTIIVQVIYNNFSKTYP
jgi:hypothetical protein